MPPVQSPTIVPTGSPLQYQGKILNLLDFKGDVTIMDSTFSNIQLRIAACSVFDGIESSFQLGQSLQIKNLLSIRRHQYTLSLVNNTFNTNSAIKGLVYIETKQAIPHG